MEEMRETPLEEESLSNQGERGEFQELDEVTTQPEAAIEWKIQIEEAEGIEKAFVNLMDQMAGNLEAISEREKEEEDGEYKVKVKFPWLLDGNEDDMEGVWARVTTLTTDGRGAWFMPETSDSVALDSDQKIPRPADIQPLERADEDGILKPQEVDEYSYYKEDGLKQYIAGEKSNIEFDEEDTGRGEVVLDDIDIDLKRSPDDLEDSSGEGGSEDESGNDKDD